MSLSFVVGLVGVVCRNIVSPRSGQRIGEYRESSEFPGQLIRVIRTIRSFAVGVWHFRQWLLNDYGLFPVRVRVTLFCGGLVGLLCQNVVSARFRQRIGK